MDATFYVSAFEGLVLSLAASFTTPTQSTFASLAAGWVLCLGRRCVTRVVASAAERAGKHLSTYHRFFRTARWEPDELFLRLATQVLVPRLAASGKLVLAGDDTTCSKFGRRVAYAGYYRDAVRSTPQQNILHWAHAWVLLSLQVRLPLWPRRVISFPLLARLYRKKADCTPAHPFRTRQELVLEMVQKLSQRLPGRELALLLDGAYPSRELLAALPENVQLVSRLRADAALYELPPRRRRSGPGRPRQKGERMKALAQMAGSSASWERRMVLSYGKKRVRLLRSFPALWWKVAQGRVLQVVIVRDPAGKEKDDYFFTTDLEMRPARVVELYAARWGIEEVIREGKQLAGFSEVQGWSERSVERQAPFALLVLSMVKAWYVWHVAPVERPAELPSVAVMFTRLRLAYWQKRISALSLPGHELHKLTQALAAALSAAA